MAMTDTLVIAHRFQYWFVTTQTDVIRRVVDEARDEAVDAARAIIRNHTLEQLLAEIADDSAGAGQASPTQPILASHPDDELGRRVVIELHGMRAQIARNEEVLLRMLPVSTRRT